MMNNPLAADLDHVLEHTRGLWEELRGNRLFITGGTGFFGRWLLDSFTWANDRLSLAASAVVLTRQPEAFLQNAPHLASHPAVRLLVGDMTSFDFPAGQFTHVIHAATETNPNPLRPIQLWMFDRNVHGTRRVLELARVSGARRFLFTSSGAVYGKQPQTLTHVPEDYLGAPPTTDASCAYAHGKRLSEFLCAAYAHNYGVEAVIARCFSLIGPHLPLNANYAVGNFIRDCLRGGPVRVQGDGTAHRSYLYAADLAVWLWTLLFRGQSARPYNVGSEQYMSIAALAREVIRVVAPDCSLQILQQPQPGALAERYVPSTARAREELGLRPIVRVEDAIERTARWYAALEPSA